MNAFLWGVYPYLCVLLFLVVPVLRMVYRPFGFSARSSGLFNRDILGLASLCLHWGLFLLFAGHVAGFLGGLIGAGAWIAFFYWAGLVGGILALFGAMMPNPWQADDSVHAALEMRYALTAYNQELVAEGLPALVLGIGLERGTGIAGLVGSQQLKEFTFVGGTGNVAARVQDLTRDHSADIIVTQTLGDSLDPRFQLRALPDSLVKGIEKPIALYAVDGFDNDGSVS